SEDTARAMIRSTIGLIPFVRDQAIVERSLPLKAFEYVACGLPVVSIPIRQLESCPDLFALADSAPAFADKIVRLCSSRWEEHSLRLRAERAAQRSYDAEFTKVCARFDTILSSRAAGTERLNVLILFDPQVSVSSVMSWQLEAFERFSRHQVLFFPVV